MYEARTPLIISGPADETPDLYIKVNRVVPKLVRQTEEEGEGDYWVDEKAKQVHLSEDGQEHAENLLREAGILEGEDDDLYSPHNIHVVHHLNAGLRAHGIYQRDVDYIRSEEHTSELQSLMRISYAVFCLKKKKTKQHLKP